ERRRYVAFGVRGRLAALVVGGCLVAVRVRDLDIETEYLVIADLQARDAGALALAGLEFCDPLLSRARERVERITQLVEPGPDDVAVARDHPRLGDHGPPQPLREAGAHGQPRAG